MAGLRAGSDNQKGARVLAVRAFRAAPCGAGGGGRNLRATCRGFDGTLPGLGPVLTTEVLADKLVRDPAALSGSRGFVFVVAYLWAFSANWRGDFECDSTHGRRVGRSVFQIG